MSIAGTAVDTAVPWKAMEDVRKWGRVLRERKACQPVDPKHMPDNLTLCRCLLVIQEMLDVPSALLKAAASAGAMLQLRYDFLGREEIIPLDNPFTRAGRGGTNRWSANGVTTGGLLSPTSSAAGSLSPPAGSLSPPRANRRASSGAMGRAAPRQSTAGDSRRASVTAGEPDWARRDTTAEREGRARRRSSLLVQAPPDQPPQFSPPEDRRARSHSPIRSRLTGSLSPGGPTESSKLRRIGTVSELGTQSAEQSIRVPIKVYRLHSFLSEDTPLVGPLPPFSGLGRFVTQQRAIHVSLVLAEGRRRGAAGDGDAPEVGAHSLERGHGTEDRPASGPTLDERINFILERNLDRGQDAAKAKAREEVVRHREANARRKSNNLMAFALTGHTTGGKAGSQGAAAAGQKALGGPATGGSLLHPDRPAGWIAEAKLSLDPFKHEYVRRMDVMAPMALSASIAQGRGSMCLLKAVVGVERTRSNVDVAALPQPLLLHRGLHLVDGGGADYHTCDPLPEEWLSIGGYVPRTKSKSKRPPGKLVRSETNLVHRGSQAQDFGSLLRDYRQQEAVSQLTSPAGIEAALESRGNSVWCFTLRLQGAHHVRGETAPPAGLQWEVRYPFMGVERRVAPSSDPVPHEELTYASEPGALPFNADSRHYVRCGVSDLRAAFMGIQKCLELTLGLAGIGGGAIPPDARQHTCKVQLHDLCRARRLDGTYPLIPFDGDCAPLQRHEFPPYLMLGVSLHRMGPGPDVDEPAWAPPGMVEQRKVTKTITLLDNWIERRRRQGV